jgi:hypothetical protein
MNKQRKLAQLPTPTPPPETNTKPILETKKVVDKNDDSSSNTHLTFLSFVN